MGVNNVSAAPLTPSPALWVTSRALYTALFSKHCSSHYRHHMLLALSPLINAAARSHLGRFSGGDPGGATLKSLTKSSGDAGERVKPAPF